MMCCMPAGGVWGHSGLELVVRACPLFLPVAYRGMAVFWCKLPIQLAARVGLRFMAVGLRFMAVHKQLLARPRHLLS